MKAGRTNGVIHASPGGSEGSATCQIGVCGGVDNGVGKGDISIGIGASHTFYSTAFGTGTGAWISTNETISQASKVISPGTACDIARRNVCSNIGSAGTGTGAIKDTSGSISSTSHDTVSIAIGTSHGDDYDSSSGVGNETASMAIGARFGSSNGASIGADNNTVSIFFGSAYCASHNKPSHSIGSVCDIFIKYIGSRNGVFSTGIGSGCKISSAPEQYNQGFNCEGNTGNQGDLIILPINTPKNARNPSKSG